MIKKCKFCNAAIRWLDTVNGKKMAVEGNSRPYWLTANGNMRIVTPAGKTIACEFTGEGEPDGHGFEPHFGYCNRRR